MTKREREIIEILRKNPMISQNDLSQKLGISRSSAAVHITNLMKKGVILGKGYVINEENFVAVLGGANIDILGFPEGKFISKDSNPGYVVQSIGGVGRNVAENLARLQVPVRFLSLVGDDMQGQLIIDRTSEAGVDVSSVLKMKNFPTGICMSMQDSDGDMINAISQMAIYDKMDESYPESVIKILESASKIVLDTNLSQKALNYLTYRLSKKEIYLDPVSVKKSARAQTILSSLEMIKPNAIEAESFTGIKIKDIDSLRENGEWFIKKGVKTVCISLGKDGVYVRNKFIEGRVTSEEIKVESTNGSGDAFMAGFVMESFETEDIREMAVAGVGAALVAVKSQETINRNLNPELIKEIVKEYKVKWNNI